MLALAKRGVLIDHVDADLMFARYTCVALQPLNGSAKKIKAVEQPTRSRDWFGLADRRSTWCMHWAATRTCCAMQKLTVRAFTPRAKTQAEKGEGEEGEKDKGAMDEDHPGDVSRGSEPRRTRQQRPRLRRATTWGTRLSLASCFDKTNANKEREELDQVAGNAEAEMGERIAGVCGTELLYVQQSLLAVYGPMRAHVCRSPHKYSKTLRAAPTLSFSRFLCVSSQFCDQHHLLLFKILETGHPEQQIVLGDVAVSFSVHSTGSTRHARSAGILPPSCSRTSGARRPSAERRPAQAACSSSRTFPAGLRTVSGKHNAVKRVKKAAAE
ncbi:hypothetical protein C8J57DRAFT_1704609 [Mycena rebaudengoi]|nr:hypothetical protein C8J57DRAFT_1704609 [Mycena rebaudengoi]